MKACLKGDKKVPEQIIDFTQSLFSTDEIIKQIASRLKNNSAIHSLVIEDCHLMEKSLIVLRQVILNHPALRHLALLNVKIFSYPKFVTEPEADYFFPKDLDRAVEHLCAILREARLESIELTNVQFCDQTKREFKHFDMVDPGQMRDLVLEEKGPFYTREIINSLDHNPHLQLINLSMHELDVNVLIKEVEENIKHRQAAQAVNNIFQGTHAAIESHFIPQIIKIFAFNLWWRHKIPHKS